MDSRGTPPESSRKMSWTVPTWVGDGGLNQEKTKDVIGCRGDWD